MSTVNFNSTQNVFTTLDKVLNANTDAPRKSVVSFTATQEGGQTIYSAEVQNKSSWKEIGSNLLHGHVKHAAFSALEKLGLGDSALGRKLDPAPEKKTDVTVFKEAITETFKDLYQKAGLPNAQARAEGMASSICSSSGTHGSQKTTLTTIEKMQHFAEVQFNSEENSMKSQFERRPQHHASNHVDNSETSHGMAFVTGSGKPIPREGVPAQQPVGVPYESASTQQQQPVEGHYYHVLENPLDVSDSGFDDAYVEEEIYVTANRGQDELFSSITSLTQRETEEYSAMRRVELGITDESMPFDDIRDEKYARDVRRAEIQEARARDYGDI